jgi:hypothetical protein
MTLVATNHTEEVGDDLPSQFDLTLTRKDLRELATTLTAHQGRYLVDLYYQIQEYRIASQGQQRALFDTEEPNAAISYMAKEMHRLELTIAAMLDKYSLNEPTGMGTWARGIVGIGPVIAAGLVAHVNVSYCATAGGLWRFAGLDPTLEWTGRDAAAELMRAAFDVERTDANAMCWLGRALHRHVSALYEAAGAQPVERDDAMKALRAQGISSEQIQEANERFPLYVDNLINNVCEENEVDAWKVYGMLYEGAKIDKTALRKHISRRPWNARLKTLCWKIGESFVKTSSNANGFYGKIYLQRKEYELERNVRGELAEQAADKLKRYKIGKGTDAYAAYSKGILPPAHIHARAKRYAVKLFLSHYWMEAYQRHFGKEPPLPYPIAFLGHAHVIERPNPGLGMENMRGPSKAH